MKTIIETCTETVFPREAYGAFHGYPCGKRAAFLSKGKPRCKIHSDEYKEAKRAKQEAAWKEAAEKREKGYEVSLAKIQLLSMIPDMLVAMRGTSASDEYIERIEALLVKAGLK